MLTSPGTSRRPGPSVRGLCRRLIENRSGTAFTELAFVAPLLLIAGLWGAELVNFVVVKQRISSVARMTADNAARMGENSPLSKKQVTESDIADVLAGAEEQSVKLDLRRNGRVILSSLERNADNGQWIHWQRCTGLKTGYASTHGLEGAGASGTAFPGMGTTAPKAQAPANSAIMFVEVVYYYEPLVGMFGSSTTIVDTAANLIRERRDLTRAFNPDGKPVKSC